MAGDSDHVAVAPHGPSWSSWQAAFGGEEGTRGDQRDVIGTGVVQGGWSWGFGDIDGDNRAQGMLRATFGDTTGTAEPRGHLGQVWGHHGDIGG